ncbi:MAG TPA: ammonium transporter [Opitutaceae bacterium]|jgi:Amt family ammonium transporter|nr:ammonium transporter [Opitutaceae bacterium]
MIQTPLPLLAAVPALTTEDRLSALEAYIRNQDPGRALAGASGPGHNAWMMTSAALVLFMTLPGLALFYGGLVRKKNVLSVLAQCLGIAGLVTVLWWAVGYSLVFGRSFGSGLLGGSEYFWLRGVTSAPNPEYSFWVSQNLFAMFQLMFAIITPALIVGAVAERMKYMALLLFVALWMLVVYFPLAHMVWGSTGWLDGILNGHAGIPAIDFAGGTVVHMSSGWSALILCLIIGPRVGFGREKMPPHSMVLCMVGTAMLWVGWYGFNAGSALAADGIAANAFTATTLAAATAAFVWGMMEKIFRGHASILGFCSGAVGGLVVITPACGFVDTTGAVIIGVLAAIVPYFFVTTVKSRFGYDDALDTFGVHAVGGTIGAILTGFLATASVNPNLSAANPAAVANGLAARVAGHRQWIPQVEAVIMTIALAVLASIVLGFLVRLLIGLRPTPEVERQGLDMIEHGEEGYIS